MVCKIAVRAEQLALLKHLYNQEREALVAYLANAEETASSAEQDVAVAQ